MNDEAAREDRPQNEEPAPASAAAGDEQIKLSRVLPVVLILAVLVVGGIAFFGVFDGMARLAKWGNPPLVAVTGQVMYQGQPLTSGVITTQPLEGDLQGAIGEIDEQGRFQLLTDIDGTYVEGAYAGQHKVTVAAIDAEVSVGPGPPPLTTPQQYSTLETTPLKINVDRSPDKNTFTLTLEGEAPQRPRRGGPPGGGGGGFATGPVNPNAIADQTFTSYDADGDDKLTREEIQAMNERVRVTAEKADFNGDGVVERAELTEAIQKEIQIGAGAGQP